MNSVLEKTANYYNILDVKEDASSDEIKKSYKKLILIYHPDVSREDNSTEKFKEIAKAYSVLKDVSLRADYDRELKNNEPFLPLVDFKYCYREIKKFSDQLFNKIKLLFNNISGVPDSSDCVSDAIDDFFDLQISIQKEILQMSIEELEDRLQFSQNPFVRINAAAALGQKREKKSYHVLERMLNDEKDDVKRSVIWAIGNLKMRKSLQLLDLVYSSNKSFLRIEILKAVYKITNGKGVLFNDLLIKAINDESEDVKISALNLLLRIDKKVLFEEVRNAFGKTSLKIRILLDKIILENKILNYSGE